MQFAVVDAEREEAFPGGSGRCPTCNAEIIAKCGPRVLHHWAHKGRRNCDPWWENETDWHREWKNHFPARCREIHHRAEDGEIHRADVKTPTGIYIEIQHSGMSDAEANAREAFYGNLLWIVDGSGFRKNFDVYHKLPHPTSDVERDIVWYKAHRGMKDSTGGQFFRLSEANRDNPDNCVTKSTIGSLDGLVEVHSRQEIESQVDAAYRGHHQYDWVRPRRTWLESTFPVFIDFGGDQLIKLEVYDITGLPCIRYVPKRRLIHEAIIKSDAHAVCNE